MSAVEYLPLVGDLPYEVVRGHVDERAARAAVFDWTGWPTDGEAVTLEHRFARFTPTNSEDAEWDMAFRLSAPGPGAFPVTLLHLPARGAATR